MNGFATCLSRPCGMWVRQCPSVRRTGYVVLGVGDAGSWLERKS